MTTITTLLPKDFLSRLAQTLEDVHNTLNNLQDRISRLEANVYKDDDKKHKR